MISTVDIKAKRYDVFTIESRSYKPTVVLVMGSCRSVPYLNYLFAYDRMAGYPFRIHFIDPFDFHWNEKNELVDIEPELEKQEHNQRILSILPTVNVFIHEHYENYGMFNTDKHRAKSIYWFGMNPEVDISIPNYDRAILLKDQNADESEETRQKGEAAVEAFCQMCQRTSFPEFGDMFRNEWRKRRFFWTINHVSAAYTLAIFRMMNDKFLKLPLTPKFWESIAREDMYANNITPVTDWDRKAYDLTWPQ